ncbi:MAG: hypothetical protein ACPGVB_14580 [Chitinophagales bacterium]
MGSSKIHTNLEGIKPSRYKRQKRRNKKLHKELTECYRENRAWIKTPRATRNRLKNYELKLGYEHAPKKVSIKFVHSRLSGTTKYFGDNVKPLKRFLNSKVGQNWDKVYSELSNKMDKRTVSGQHLFEHIFQYVEADTAWIDGKVYRSNGTKMFRNRWHGGRLQLYVHPISRTLHRFRRKYYGKIVD